MPASYEAAALIALSAADGFAFERRMPSWGIDFSKSAQPNCHPEEVEFLAVSEELPTKDLYFAGSAASDKSMGPSLGAAAFSGELRCLRMAVELEMTAAVTV